MVNSVYRKKKKPFVSYTIYAFNLDEIKRMLEACTNTADYLMILLSYRYGFRREDIAKVRLSNIDFVNNTLTFHEQKKDRDRTLPIEPDVVSELRRYKATVPKNQVYLLPFNDGSTCWIHLQDICTAAKIPVPPGRTGRPFHSLRGTCVKYRQSQGWSVNQCAALLGDEPETVMKHYLTTTTDELAALMKEKLGEPR
jgi:integrase